MEPDRFRLIGIDARTIPVHQCRNDSLPFWMLTLLRTILEADPVASRASQVALQVICREEDNGVKPRKPNFGVGCFSLEQG